MKIALLTPTYCAFSGIDRIVELQARDYQKKGNKVTIFTFKTGLSADKAKLVVLKMPKNSFLERIYRLFFFLDISKTRKYSQMLKNFDLVISHQYPMNILGCKAKNYGVKYIYYNHGVAYPSLFRNLTEKIYMILFNIFTNMTARKADEVISISKYLQKEFKKETGIESRVVYDKIDTERFHKNISCKGVREKYNLKKYPVFLYVGRISPHKGIHLLIKSFNLLLKERPDAKLIIVGKQTFGSYAKELIKLANKLKPESIIFAGFVDDKELPKYYAACDIYVTASLWEGFDMPVVEAQACGKKVIAFDCCSHPEVVKKGILVKTGDVEEFAKAMLKMIN